MVQALVSSHRCRLISHLRPLRSVHKSSSPPDWVFPASLVLSDLVHLLRCGYICRSDPSSVSHLALSPFPACSSMACSLTCSSTRFIVLCYLLFQELLLGQDSRSTSSALVLLGLSLLLKFVQDLCSVCSIYWISGWSSRFGNNLHFFNESFFFF